jgi:hypothetical protein
MWTGICLFLLKLGALRQIKHEFRTPDFIRNIDMLSGADIGNIAHPDTLTYLLKKISTEDIDAIRKKMIDRLIRMRCIEQDKLLYKYYVVAVDATGHIDFGHIRHCPRCLSSLQNGKVRYYHPVVEAKLVSPRGFALSIETEFIENEEGALVEDCELRAAYRLLKRLKKKFPQLEICLSLDALYANQQIFDICRSLGWKYVITFKEGSMPAVYIEAMAIKELQKENRALYENNEVIQHYAWATDIEYQTHTVHVLECVEVKHGETKKKRYVWLTNINISYDNVKEIATNAGRLRWKIENEGFNMQKNGGYRLEHIYSSHVTAMKNFYLLLQIAHFISQLMEKGSLLKERITRTMGGIRTFTRRLLEGLRSRSFTSERIQHILSTACQIRFNSS